MTQRYHNPFVGIDLLAPIRQRQAYDRYCQTGGSSVIDSCPFPRMVDLWFAGICLAARQGLRPIDLTKEETFKFHDGSVFESDSWRVQALMLIAIAVAGRVDIVNEPRRIISLANGLAAAGVPVVVEMIENGNQPPIWNLSDNIMELLRSEGTTG